MCTIAVDYRRVIAGVDWRKKFDAVVLPGKLGRRLDQATSCRNSSTQLTGA